MSRTFEPVFVGCSDWHLSESAYVNRDVMGDAIDAVTRIVDYACEHNLPVVSAGDLFDAARPPATVVAAALQQIDRLQEHGLGFYYTQGQHDVDREFPWLSLHPWATHLHRQSFDIGDVRVYGIDWVPSGRITAELEAVPSGTHVVAAHQVWCDFMGSRGEPDALFSSVPNAHCLLTGDFHEHTSVKAIGATGLPMLVLSPGSAAMQSISEPADKAFWVVGRNDGGEIDARSVYYPTRPVLRYTLTNEQDMTDWSTSKFPDEFSKSVQAARDAGLAENLCHPLIEVRFDATLTDVHARIESAVVSRGHLFAKPIRVRSSIVDGSPLSPSSSSPLDVLTEFVPADSPAYALLRELYEIDNPARLRAAIVAARSAFLTNRGDRDHPPNYS